jgi:hypothetical protein
MNCQTTAHCLHNLPKLPHNSGCEISKIGKIMEGLLKEKMAKHLEDAKVLNDRQHGFMTGRLYQTNMLEMFEN